jgi:hypothetical protein
MDHPLERRQALVKQLERLVLRRRRRRNSQRVRG